MKLLLVLFSVIVLCLAKESCSEDVKYELTFDVKADDTSSHATIYSSGGSTIERTFQHIQKDGDEDLAGSDVTLRIKNLEVSSELDSLSFKGISYNPNAKESKEIVINEVKVVEIYSDEKRKEIDEQIEALQSQIQILQKRLTRHSKLLDFYDKAVEKSVEDYKVFKEAMADYLEEKDKYYSIMEEISNEIDSTREVVQKLRNKRNDLKTEYVVEVICQIPKREPSKDNTDDGEQRYLFTLSYNMLNAIWKPSYVLRIDSALGNGNLEYYGNIQQWSEYDWKEFEISLSDSNIKKFHQPPKIEPLRITTIDPNMYRKSRQSNFGSSRRKGSERQQFFGNNIQRSYVDQEKHDYKKMAQEALQSDASASAPSPGTSNSNDKRTTRLTDITQFHIDQRKDIPRQKQHQSWNQIGTKVLVMPPFSISSQFIHFHIPQQSLDTFVQMKGTHEHEFGILPGDLNIIVDGAFVSKSEIIDPIYMNGIFEVWIGKDNFVKFHKLPMKSKKERRGLLSTTLVETKTIEMTVENLKSVPANITIIDSIPYPQNLDLEVFIEEPFKSIVSLRELHQKNEKERKEGKRKKWGKFGQKYFFDEDGKFVLVDKDSGETYKITKENIFERNLLIQPKEKKSFVLQYSIHTKGDQYYVKV